MGKEYGLRSKKVSLTADFFASSPSAGISLRPHAAATISIKSAIMQHPGRLIVNPAAITDIQGPLKFAAQWCRYVGFSLYASVGFDF